VDFSHYSDQSVEMAVELINTTNRYSGGDELEAIDGLRTFLDRYQDEWHPGDWHGLELTESDRREVVSLRERLRSVFDTTEEAGAAELLNGILADVAATPRISLHSGGAHLHFEPTRGRVAQWLGAATAMGLAVVLVDYGIERFGTCSAGDCVDAYVDTSRNRSRKHCSTSCTNRENVAAYRQRARAGN